MISSIIDLVLLAALAGTSGAVILMYRRLQRFDALQGEAAREFARSSEALDRGREAIVALQADGGEMAVTLVGRLNEARTMMNDIDDATMRTRETFAELVRAMTEPPLAPPAPANHANASMSNDANASMSNDATASMSNHANAGSMSNHANAFPANGTTAPDAGMARGIAADNDATIEAEVACGPAAPLSAAIRIRNAARARIEATRTAAALANGHANVNANVAPQPAVTPRRPGPHTAPLPPRLPERITPRIHKAPEAAFAATPASATLRFAQKPVPNGPVMMTVADNEDADAAATIAARWSPPHDAAILPPSAATAGLPHAAIAAHALARQANGGHPHGGQALTWDRLAQAAREAR